MAAVFTEIGKFIGSKVAGALIALAVIAGGIWCWQNPEAVKAFGHAVKVTLIWIAIAAALPWSSYFFMRPLMAAQSKMQSASGAGAVSIAVIAAFFLIDVLLAGWLADWSISGSLTWMVVIIGFLAAGAYNFVICESLARYVDR